MISDQVVLVNERDAEVGVCDKFEAHQKGLLHRAISIFIFSTKGEMLLQKRARHKYHSGGLWSNTCCSHPRPDESVAQSSHRRLQEEMGFDCLLKKAHTFTYRTEFDNGLIEHEFDHVLVGVYDGTPVINKSEAEDWKWMTQEAVVEDVRVHPEQYSYWFKISLADILAKMQK